MSQISLTDMALRRISPPPFGSLEVWDGKIPGFGIRVSPKGTKSFILVFRVDGRARRLTIGRYPTLSLAEARSLAKQALSEIAQGNDPAEKKKQSRNTSERDPFAFESFVAEFIEKYARPKNKDWAESHRLLKREFVKHWGKRDIRKINKPDITLIIDGIVTRGSPSAANHALAAIRRLFNWAVERGVIDFSPCQGLKPPGKLKSRERVLSDDELVAIWNAASSEAYPFGIITQLLMLTGQRRGEVIAMRWQDLDLTHSVWSLPGDLNKSGRAHEIPLTPSAVIILRQLPRLHEVLVFPANRKGTDNPVSGIGKAKQRIEKSSDVADWRLHDIRRTVATGMARLKITPHVVEKVLNHSSGTFSGVAGVYNRFGYLPEMREALEAWEAHLTSLLET